MDNQAGMIYEFKFNPTSYEFREINAAFFTFLGARLYSSFDRILSEELRVRLKETVYEKRFGSVFVLDVFAENGKSYVISYEAVTEPITRNLEDMNYFRIFDMIFEKFCVFEKVYYEKSYCCVNSDERSRNPREIARQSRGACTKSGCRGRENYPPSRAF